MDSCRERQKPSILLEIRCQGKAYSIQDSHVSWWKWIEVLYIEGGCWRSCDTRPNRIYCTYKNAFICSYNVHMQYILVLEYVDGWIDR